MLADKFTDSCYFILFTFKTEVLGFGINSKIHPDTVETLFSSTTSQRYTAFHIHMLKFVQAFYNCSKVKRLYQPALSVIECNKLYVQCRGYYFDNPVTRVLQGIQCD